MSEAEHIDISGQQKSGMDNKSTHQTLEGVQLQPVQNTGNTSEKEHQSDTKALQTKPLQESSRIFDFDTTVSFEEHLSDSGSIVSKTVEYQNATVVDGQCQLAERTNFLSQSVIDEKDCFSINELLLTDYPPGFEVHPSVAEEKECSGIKETITDYPPGFEINTLHDVTSKPGHSNNVRSDLAEVEQLGNSSGMEYNTLGQSSVGVGHSKHSALVEEDRPATGFDDAGKDVVDHYEWSSIIETFSEYPPGFGVEIMHDADHKSNRNKDLVEDGVSVLKSKIEQTGPSVDHKVGQKHEQLVSASESVAEDLHNRPTDTGHNNGVVNTLPASVEWDSEPVTEDLSNCPTVIGHDDGAVNTFPTSAKLDSEAVVEDFHIRTTSTGHDDVVVDPFPTIVKQDSEPVAEDLHICPTVAGYDDGVANPVRMSGKKDSDHSCRRQRRAPHTKVKSRYSLRSSLHSTKLSASSSQGKPEDQNQNDAAGNVSDRGRKKRGRKKRMEKKSHDEFSKTRVHLRYLLNRMKYDLTLLEAYSSEGWRGQSLEKLRPEKELERAKADINRRKSKIRSLFQHLDSICAEGRFPDSLYDSDGLIDSEDIYCAKCGSKELTSNNDIILCDGACDRGFHQFCLDPPLRTEEIPPGDQGWLCPACDCKVDCIDLLNDYHVTKLSVGDCWEKVFPEAATAASGNGQDDGFILPSDDSDDNDYDPDKADNDDADDDKDEASGSSSESTSNESDFSSASEDLGAICGVQQDLGLPSDDSEDDDFDPNAPEMDEQDKQDLSSSDFTSASEDLGAAHDTGVPGKDREPQPVPEPDHCGDDAGHISARRHVERLDYKKLYDETYGNASSESSDDDDDEEWKDTSDTRQVDSTVKIKITPGRQRNFQSPAPEGMEDSRAWLNKKSPKSTTGSKIRERGSSKRLGDETKQRLHALFKENQYPNRTTKENLAKELGITPHQVSKWFGNARWSFNHPSHGGPNTPQSASRGRGGNNPSKVEASTSGSVSKGHARKNPSQGEASTPESVSKVRARKIPSQGEVSTPGSSSKGRAKKNLSQGEASIPERVSKGRARKNLSQTEENTPGSASKGHARKKPSQGETITPGSASKGHARKKPSQGETSTASKRRGAKRKSKHEDYPDLPEFVACNGSKKPSTRARAAFKHCGDANLRINNFDAGESSTKQSMEKQSRKRKTDAEDQGVVVALPSKPDKLQTQGIPEVGSSHAVEVQRGRPGRRKSGA